MVPDVFVRWRGPSINPRLAVSFVAAICRTYLFSLGSLLFGSLISSLFFLLALSRPLPATHCIVTSFHPIQVLNKV